MAGLDDLIAQIPVQDIASKIGADEGEVNNAIRTLVPALVGGVRRERPGRRDRLERPRVRCRPAGRQRSARRRRQRRPGRRTAGRPVRRASIFGGNDSNAVASALAGQGAGGGDLIKKLLPILAPIVLAYIGKQFDAEGAAPAGAGTQAQAAPAAAASATCSAASSAARRRRWRRQQPAGQHPGQRARRRRWRRAIRSGRSSAGCSAVRSSPSARAPAEPGEAGPTSWQPALPRMAR